MALTIEEQHETNDLDHDILATREVTFIFPRHSILCECVQLFTYFGSCSFCCRRIIGFYETSFYVDK